MKHPRLRHALRVAGSFLLLAAIVAAAYLALRAVFAGLSSANPGVAASLVAAFVAVFGYVYTQYQSKSRDIAETHRAAKVTVYEYFFDIFEQLPNLPGGDAPIPADVQVLFRKFTRGLIAWGSPAVIGAWLRFRSLHSADPTLALFGIDDVLQAIRKDLGNSNRNLKRGDLLKVIMKDPGEIDLLKVRPPAGTAV